MVASPPWPFAARRGDSLYPAGEPTGMDGPLVRLWNLAFGPAWPMDPRLWEQNLAGHPSWDPEGLFLEGTPGEPRGFALARRAAGQAWIEALAVHPEHRGRGLGTRLLERACAWAGLRPVRLGAGPAHFFPGVPDDCPGARDFFRRRGFEPDWEAWDLVRELPERAPGPLPEGILPCPGDRVGDLVDFLDREFPGRWRADTLLRLERGEDPGNVLVALVEGRVEGFCHVFHPGCRTLGPSVYWRPEGGALRGGLGPVGVSRAVRGRGLGRDLVEGAVRHLQVLGCREMGVDWTILLDFYAGSGFRPDRRYQGMARPAP